MLVKVQYIILQRPPGFAGAFWCSLLLRRHVADGTEKQPLKA